jgi:transposase-like protein
MTRQVNSVLWNEWRQQLKRQRESGLSITAFCRGEDLSPHTFYAWRRKLRPARQVRGFTTGRQGQVKGLSEHCLLSASLRSDLTEKCRGLRRDMRCVLLHCRRGCGFHDSPE